MNNGEGVPRRWNRPGIGLSIETERKIRIRLPLEPEFFFEVGFLLIEL
jgi:hypothetical protein